ncbi:ABC transporter substrate-binding protein [Sphaerisporangium sp. TRM90804]|uniref:ABC transporter substrate-binding protein n=1 Tax=Sphaerisporangium sp. TRM90804 TaxID=3031113 RepID=UPI00244C940F|nr:ABC transporter substrate-binding protein [Sphaerisporangium sp. TRM90804]MDH2426063.1 ABC transporter substrate-binding protein [Sphaerisporangium sp. TRM90804]
MGSLLLALTACADADAPAAGAREAAPAVTELTSCGLPLKIASPPRRAVSMEQNATEIMLALGLAGRMAGTAYRTDPVLPELEADYGRVPVLAAQYPGREALLATEPDFVYSMRASAYAPDAGGARQELAELGIPAYLSSNDCEDPGLIPSAVTFDAIFGEVVDIAKIFGIPERGESVVAGLRERLQAAKDVSGASAGSKLMWYYSGTKTPAVAGRGGLPDTITTFLGADNAFSDIPRQWSEGSWEKIAERDPDVIVLADLTRGGDGDSAADKMSFLRSDPVASRLTAVRENRFIVVPGSAMDPSIRSVGAVEQVGAGMRDLRR